jgi:hypothetical protein
VTIPAAVRTIGASAFQSCTGLTSVTIPAAVRTIGASAFQGCTGLTSLTIPENLDTIGSGAFQGDNNITSVVWNARHVRCYGQLFAGFDQLNDVTFGDSVESIPSEMFSFCTGLTSINISNSITTIGDAAFYYCTGLTSVSIPESVVEIGADAFSNTGLTSVTIPTNVATIGYTAFAGNASLASVIWNASNAYVVFSPPYSENKSIFDGCNRMNSVTFGDSVRTIPAYIFYKCTGLTSVTIPINVDFIGEAAFGGDTNITSIIWNARNITRYPAESRGWNSSYTGMCSKNGAFTDSPIANITFGDTVQSLPAYALAGFSHLTTVTLPSSLNTIGSYAFNGCDGLTTISIPAAVSSIGKFAFDNCHHLTVINVAPENTHYSAIDGILYSHMVDTLFCCPRAKSGSVIIPDSTVVVAAGAFGERYGIVSLTIGSGIATIDSGAFCSDTSLTSIVWRARNVADFISESNAAFYGCKNITSIIFVDSVQSIPAYVFFSDNRTTSIIIPDSVTSIGEEAFSGCTGLTDLVLGSSLTSIGEHAFDGCSHLTSITSSATTAPAISTNTFSGVGTGTPIHVPCGSVQDYRNASFWFNFSNISENSNCNATMTAVPNAASMGTVMGGGTFTRGTEVTIAAIAHPGYRFNGWNDNVTDNPRNVTLSKDTVFTAMFGALPASYMLTVMSSNSSWGVATGGGNYESGTTATIAAVPANGYYFTQWNDGVTANPRTVTVSQAAFFVANFAAGQFTHDTIRTTVHDTVSNIVHDTITQVVTHYDTVLATVHDTVINTVTNYDTVINTVHDTITNTVHDTIIHTVTNYDTVVNTVHDTITNTVYDTIINTVTNYDTVINTVHDTITNIVHDTITNIVHDTITNTVHDTVYVHDTYYTLTAQSDNSSQGMAAGSGRYPENCTVTIVALPEEGYRFTQWNDGNTENPRQITITGDATYTASFSTVGIEEPQAVKDLTLYPNPTLGNVTISNQDVVLVEVYDGIGKCVATFNHQYQLNLSTLAAGSYTLRIVLPEGTAIRKVIKK